VTRVVYVHEIAHARRRRMRRPRMTADAPGPCTTSLPIGRLILVANHSVQGR